MTRPTLVLRDRTNNIRILITCSDSEICLLPGATSVQAWLHRADRSAKLCPTMAKDGISSPDYRRAARCAALPSLRPRDVGPSGLVYFPKRAAAAWIRAVGSAVGAE